MWKTIDGGKTIKWSNSGYNAIATTGKWTFNVNNPDYIVLSSQDYNGGYSTDGGKTWTYLPWRGVAWGGFTYGAYMLNEKTMFVCDALGWTDPRYLWVTFDAGENCVNTGIQVKGLEAGMGCLNDDKVAFMGEWRTDDGGHTWTEMTANSVTGSLGCKGVLDVDMKTGTLFGANGNRVVYSTDKGITWYQIANVGANVTDLAYDYNSGKLYVTAKDILYTCYVDFNNKDNRMTATKYAVEGQKEVAESVVVDPNNPNIVYVGGNGDINYTSYDTGGVYRSLDAGKTWTCLTRLVGDGRDDCADGGKKAIGMSVNAKTGELFVACACRGMWKIAPPPQWYLDTLSGDDITAKDPVDQSPEFFNKTKKDLLETGRHANYSGYTPKTVTLELINKDAGVEYGYFKVPDGVTIYTGDQIKLGCSYATTVTLPNGNRYSSLFINTTSVNGSWNYNRQACINSSGYHSFSQPGYYTIYSISSSSSAASGYALVTFYVADPYAGYTEISNEAELKNIKNDLSGNYILTEDIALTDWSTVAGSFNGVLYGNGHKISGLTSPLFEINNGGISHIEVSGTVNGNAMIAKTNDSYIAYCKVSGQVTGGKIGAVANINNGIISNCLVDAQLNGTSIGAIAGTNTFETVEVEKEEITGTDENGEPIIETVVTTETHVLGTINGCYYADGFNAIADGMLAEGDVNYTYTDITDATQFANLDNNWYQLEGAAPSLAVEYGYTDETFYDIFKGYVVKGDYLYIDCLNNPVDMFIGDYEFEGATLGAYKADGTAMSATDYLYTGDTFTMSWNGTKLALKVVIVGDILANGKVTSAGFNKLLLHVAGHSILDGAFELAGDLDGDGSTDSADLLIYRQALLGLTEFLA